jgi:hypothetical protein
MIAVDYSKKNLQNATFKGAMLANSSFAGCDLRGADFTEADLTGADLSNIRTGITSANTAIILFIAISVSMLSGYVAMVAGTTIHEMVGSADTKVRASGFTTVILVVLFLIYYYWKGGLSVIWHLLVPAMSIAIVVGIGAHFSGLGTGRGMFFLVISLLMTVVMVAIGTVARALAGSTSSTILFIIVAAAGSIFGKSLGGGIGTVILAIACAMISKRALSGAKGFEALRKITSFITSKWGTSFRGTKLTGANFAQSKIHNADFSNSDLTLVDWEGSKKENCTM